MEYEKDKVYLQDTRNGRVYQYSTLLAAKRYIKEVVLNPSETSNQPKKDGAAKDGEEGGELK